MKRQLGLLVMLLSACGVEQTQDTKEVSVAVSKEQPLFVLNSSRWPRPQIPVCWESPGNDVPKAWVQQAVEGAYENRPEFYVDFTGWGLCDWHARGIRISTGDCWPATSALGNNLDGVFGGMCLNFSFATLRDSFPGCVVDPLNPASIDGNKQCIMAIAAHEFGHALGAAHEQNRGDTPSTCTQAPQGQSGDLVTGNWDLDSIMNYCNPVWNNNGALSVRDRDGFRRLYGAYSGSDIHTGRFDGDAKLDRLYRQGAHFEYVWTPPFGGSSYQYVPTTFILAYGKGGGRSWQAEWCTHATAEFNVGDFDGDGIADLLCRDTSSGYVWVDYASNGYGSTDFEASMGFCTDSGDQLYLGDFNHDQRQDIACHSNTSGRTKVYYASSYGFSWSANIDYPNWCWGGSGAFFGVGDFDGDGYADLFCHSTATGQKWIQPGLGAGGFLVPWTGLSGTGWCTGPNAQLEIADFNNDKRSDLLCHEKSLGLKWIAYAKPIGLTSGFTGTDYYWPTAWCNHPGSRFSVGDESGDGKADWYCDDGDSHHWMATNGINGPFSSILASWGYPYFY
jgi:FG-GAP-like repeat